MSKTKTHKTVVVLGTGGSGTSAVAGILQILGVEMGEMVPPHEHNPRGDFEDKDFIVLNKKIYRRAGGKDYWNPPSPASVLAQKKRLAKAIQTLVQKKSIERLWGWKEPMTTLTLELFLPYLANPYFVIVSRDLNDSARSLHKLARRQKVAISFRDVGKLVQFYSARINALTRHHMVVPTLYITHENLIHAPVQGAARLARFLDVPLTDKVKKEIRSFIAPPRRIRYEQFVFRWKNRRGQTRLDQFLAKCINHPSHIPRFIKEAVHNSLFR